MQGEIDVPAEIVKWFDGQKGYGHPDTAGMDGMPEGTKIIEAIIGGKILHLR
jgi:hypothetical protein